MSLNKLWDIVKERESMGLQRISYHLVTKQQGINLQNIQTAHIDQYQKTNNPTKKWKEDLNIHFSKEEIRSDQISRSVVSDSLRPHQLQPARPPCPSPDPGVHSDSRPSSQ